MPLDMNDYKDFTIGGLIERWEGEARLRDEIAQDRGNLQRAHDALVKEYCARGRRIEELETALRVLTGIVKITETA